MGAVSSVCRATSAIYFDNQLGTRTNWTRIIQNGVQFPREFATILSVIFVIYGDALVKEN